MSTKDGWDIAVDIAQIVSAIGTMLAVIVTLWLTYAARRPKVRIELSTHRQIFTSARPSEGRLVVTNLGDRNLVLVDARWRLGWSGKSMSMIVEFYGDDQEEIALTWTEIRPQVPRPYQLPYSYNARNLQQIIDAPLTVRRLRRVRLEVEFSSGHVSKLRLPKNVAEEIIKFVG